MRKDIEIPEVTKVHVAIAHEWNEDFLGKDWNAYLINDREDTIETVLVVSTGYDGETKTATFRHLIGQVPPHSFAKIELLQEEVLKLNNEFYVTFFAEGKLFEKRFVFKKYEVSESALRPIPQLNLDGILAD